MSRPHPIIAPIGDDDEIGKIAVTPRVQVVDGQQRLTTFQLFLAALREVARKSECIDMIAQINGYIFNTLRAKDNKPLAKFKLTPTPSDREVFHTILEEEYSAVRAKYSEHYWGNGVPKKSELKALRAYELFIKHINQFAKFGPSDSEANVQADKEDSDLGKDIIETRLEALLTALLNQLKLVVIKLGEGDHAQVIFETLNSKGEPLLAMDLVRNNIFHRAEKQGASADELYQELWDPFDETWWREPAPYARPYRPRIDHFLAHVLSAETGQKISMRELYAEYRAFAVPQGRPRFESVVDELRVLERHSPSYQTLEGRIDGDPTLAWLGRKFTAWQVTTAYPIALQIAVDNVGENERLQIAKLIYSYIVRRAVCDLTAKNLNRVFQGISQKFAESGPSVAALIDFFDARPGESTRFPRDDEFRRGIISTPVYQKAPGERVKDILWELELASRPPFAERIEMPHELWTEHVLPISWDESWPLPDVDKLIPRWTTLEQRNVTAFCIRWEI